MGILKDTLRSIEFLAELPETAITQFMVLGRSVEYPKGHVFWRAAGAPQLVVIPITGEAKTSTKNEEGREFIDRFLASGECIGLASALDGMPHPTDAEVVRDGEFFTMARADLLRFLDQHPQARAAAVQMIGMLYRRALREREDVALRPAPQRVAEFLLNSSCVRQADGAKVLVHATQAELAARLGTVREVVARIFGDFEQRGLIERTPQGIFVSDWDGLHAEAGLDPPSQAERAARGLHADPSGTRTSRFFLPTIERRRRRQRSDDASSCKEHLGDLSLCRDRGCPAAAEADAKPRPRG
jgi:CRP/FNR family transcriptional regulator